ncbi:hypothetical protein ATN88_09230 [Enterovibrio coralii]|uniref:Uncharacterized protein n=1 Tax=Enterovibrio coralii TaxID=294935 RepID=A0A135IA50_9GAMM|nr:hypothetical protein ATN88_09230 [Enterovibrio coralii]
MTRKRRFKGKPTDVAYAEKAPIVRCFFAFKLGILFRLITGGLLGFAQFDGEIQIRRKVENGIQKLF